jgi:predicted MPP superfamily phosphohydrolase
MPWGWILVALAALAAAAVPTWAWFEAGWLRRRVLEASVPGLPSQLDGARIVHLSDFHLGAPLSRGNGASERAARWAASRDADLVALTGDLVSHPRGEARLRRILGVLPHTHVVLGNHDIAITRDPFSRAMELDDLAGAATLLRDEAVIVSMRGVDVQLVGVDPATCPDDRGSSARLADPAVSFRVLLCHYPNVVKRLPQGAFHLVLAGHLHAGQIVVPLPGRSRTLAHLTAQYVKGLYRVGDTVMHVSAGTGTTFVPFRLFARPEVTELVLRRA